MLLSARVVWVAGQGLPVQHGLLSLGGLTTDVDRSTIDINQAGSCLQAP